MISEARKKRTKINKARVTIIELSTPAGHPEGTKPKTGEKVEGAVKKIETCNKWKMIRTKRLTQELKGQGQKVTIIHPFSINVKPLPGT
jgi:hypothetical protein